MTQSVTYTFWGKGTDTFCEVIDWEDPSPAPPTLGLIWHAIVCCGTCTCTFSFRCLCLCQQVKCCCNTTIRFILNTPKTNSKWRSIMRAHSTSHAVGNWRRWSKQGLRHQTKCGGAQTIHVNHQLTKSSDSCCDVGCNYHTNVYNY